MNIASAIRLEVQTTNRIVALDDCLHTWDGDIDLEVIVGGIADRMSAMGQPIDGAVGIERVDLDTVNVEFNGYKLECRRNDLLGTFLVSEGWEGADGIKYAIAPHNPLKGQPLNCLFRKEELMRICEWLTNNFYCGMKV